MRGAAFAIIFPAPMKNRNTKKINFSACCHPSRVLHDQGRVPRGAAERQDLPAGLQWRGLRLSGQQEEHLDDRCLHHYHQYHHHNHYHHHQHVCVQLTREERANVNDRTMPGDAIDKTTARPPHHHSPHHHHLHHHYITTSLVLSTPTPIPSVKYHSSFISLKA